MFFESHVEVWTGQSRSWIFYKNSQKLWKLNFIDKKGRIFCKSVLSGNIQDIFEGSWGEGGVSTNYWISNVKLSRIKSSNFKLNFAKRFLYIMLCKMFMYLQHHHDQLQNGKFPWLRSWRQWGQCKPNSWWSDDCRWERSRFNSNIVDMSGEISVTSMGEVTTKSINGEKAVDGNQMAKNEELCWKAKQDTSGKYIEKLEYQGKAFSKKVKTLKQLAELLAKQTGAEIKITSYNSDSKK